MTDIDPSVVKAAQEAIDLAAPTGVPQTVADEFLHLIANAVKAARADAARAEVARLRAAVEEVDVAADYVGDHAGDQWGELVRCRCNGVEYERDQHNRHVAKIICAALAATEDQP